MKNISDATKEFASDTLTGDIASFLVDRFRSWESAFRYMGEEQQQDIIDDCKRSAAHLVRSVVDIIAADGKETIPVQIQKVENNGDEIKVAIKASRMDEHRHALFDGAGHAAHIIIAETEKYEGGEMPQPDPDQPGLPETEAA